MHVKRILENTSFFILLVSLFILPLPLGSNRPWAWSIFQVLIALSTLTTLASLNREKLYLFKPALLLLAGFIVVQCLVLVQLLPIFDEKALSLDVAQTKISLLRGVCYCLFIYCCFFHLHNRERIEWFVYTIVGAALFQALYAIYLQYGGFDLSPLFNYPVNPQRATGSFVYHNHAANYLMLGGSLTVGLLVGQLKRSHVAGNWRRHLAQAFDTLLSKKWLLRITIICILIAIILTRSRMGNSAFLVGLVATSLLAIFIMKRRPIMLKWLFISFIVIDIALVGAMFGIEKVKERIDSTSFQGESRDEVVIMSIPLIEDNWLLGTGAGTFYTAFPKYHQDYMAGFYDHAHNEYIQFAVEYGVPATLLLGLLIFYCLFNAIQTLRKESDSLKQGIAFGCIMAIIGMLMHATVDFPLQATANTVNFIAVLVLCIVSRHVNLGRNKRS
jgi:putative inorganic carbon (HCO3(-)) transporter